MGTWRILLLAVVLLLCGCGRAANPAIESPGPLATPPDQALDATLPAGLAGPAFPADQAPLARRASDDTVQLFGNEWHEKSANAEEIGSTLEINGPDRAWGIYALGGFGQVQPGGVFASFYTEDDMPCRIYLGVADFSEQRWRFMDAGKDDASYVFPAGGNYTSPSGNCYVCVLRIGEGKAKLYSLSFSRLGSTDLEAPAGLSGTADPGVVHLDWLPVDGAVGYNVYRAYDHKFTNQIRLNEEPIAGDAYEDSFVVNSQLYFYRVTAVGAIESAYSDTVGIYVPVIDLPAPQNLRVLDVGDDYIEFAWDWEGPGPSGGWAVFLANGRNFNLDPPTEKRNISSGGARSYKYTGLNPGRLYYVRMAAQVSGQLGRLTDALPCLTGDQWQWFDVEEIGDGKEPVVGVIADGQLCASYMLDNVVHVALNSGQGQPWIVENTALDKSITFFNEKIMQDVSAGGFINNLDIDYHNGTYLIASVTLHHNDYYSAIGAPGVGWEVQLIDEGTGGFLTVPTAGLFNSVAISDNGYNASGLDYYLHQYCHYTRPLGKGKPWTKHEIRTVPEGPPVDFDYEVLNGQLFASYMDYVDHQLYLWSEESGNFTQVTDNPEGVSFGLYSDLERLDDHWVSSAYHGSEQDIYLLQDKGNPVWDSEIISASDDYNTGRNCRLEPFRDGVVCVYMGGGTRDWYCSVLRGDGSWETQLMKIGEIDAYEKCDLKILNDQPVFLVADRITQKVYAVRGNIPLD